MFIGEQMKDSAPYVHLYRVIDPKTGEVLAHREKFTWSGWYGDEYKYRPKAASTQIFFDAGFDLTKQGLALYWELLRMMNRDNLLTKPVTRRKYSSVLEYAALTKEDIFECVHFSKSTFDRAWKELNGKYIKKIQVGDLYAWAVNPAYALKGKYLAVELYEAFSDDIDRFLNPVIVQKFKNILEERRIEENLKHEAKTSKKIDESKEKDAENG